MIEWLAEIYAADDAWRAEHEDWLARRNAVARPPVSEMPPGGILYRDYAGNAALPAPQPKPVQSNGDGSIFDTERDKRLAKAIGKIAAELRREFDDEIELLHQLLNLAEAKLRGEFRTATMKLKRELSTMGREIEADRANGIEVYCAGLEHRVAVLEAENIKLKAKFATRAAENAQPRSKQNDDRVKELAVGLEAERKDREALFAAMETRFAGLHGLVRGLAQDWNAPV